MKNRWRAWWWLLLLLPVAAGFFRLRFDTEMLNLLPADRPVVQGLKIYQEHFADGQSLLLTVKAPEAETASAAAQSLAETLRAQSNLVASAVWQPPWLEHPVASAELLAYLWLNQPPAEVAALTARLAPAQWTNTLENTRNRLATSFSPGDIMRLSNDPFDLMQLPGADLTEAPGLSLSQKMFASDDGTFRVIFVQPSGPRKNYRQNGLWMQSLREVVKTWRQTAPATVRDVEIGFTGTPAFSAEIGGGMEKDLAGPSLGTLAIIALLFYGTHRRWLPLLWLIVLLVVILGVTIALGGFVLGTLNVVSLGFASVLFGLAEDFGIVLYHESQAHPELSATELRRRAFPGIFWSAVTTCGAFLLLNLSGLPGLGQLGTLVAIGIAVAAVVMLYAYLPPLRRRLPVSEGHGGKKSAPVPTSTTILKPTRSDGLVWGLTGVLLVGGGLLLWWHPPQMDRSPDALRPKNSEAYAAMEVLQKSLWQGPEPVWLVVTGPDEAAVAADWQKIEPALNAAVQQGQLTRFVLPSALWPQPTWQRTNAAALQPLVSEKNALMTAALRSGFAPEALLMTTNMIATWEAAGRSSGVFWPTNDNSRWIFSRVAVRAPDGCFALGLLYPATNVSSASLTALAAQMPPGTILSGWGLLGPEISRQVVSELPRVCGPILLLVLLTLWLAFRNGREVVLSLATLVVGGFCLSLLMTVFGWSWNMMNMMAIPLILGLGVDFSIHMQLALRRAQEEGVPASHGMGGALLLAGTTTVAGFGALLFSSNAGLASLGQVCGTGIACTMLVAVFFLPVWWRAVQGGRPAAPSSLYCGWLWRGGLVLSRVLPASFCFAVARAGGLIYWAIAAHRRNVVICNLMPVLDGNPAEARTQSRRLFQNFAQKLVELWRSEAGADLGCPMAPPAGWEYFKTAQARGKGVLIITPHLGNWELGGHLLREQGVDLYVVTLREPDDLTERRQAARAQLGIKTIVVGDDPFTAVEIIRRLQEGATVAILVDRPPPSGAVPVEFFGRPFAASVAVAQLARASGCALVPVILPRTAQGYAAQALPEITYDRARLNTPEARRLFTQEIMRAFAPAIRQNPDQWYHFVPIWPA